MLIDIHSHLDHSRFKKDLDKVIEKCRKSGVKTIITSGVNSSTNRKILEIQKTYPDIVKVSFGLYPIDALNREIENGEGDGFVRDTEKIEADKELEFIEQNKDKCVAIGEVGLDYKWSTEEKEHEQQKQVFEKVIKLAKKINKPLIIHSRKAESDALGLLEKNNAEKVILHCFNGRKSQIKRAVELGYYFSIPPIITRLQHFQLLVSIVPLEQLLTETDSPYLSSIPGQRNDSSQVKITIKEIAKIKSLTEKEIEEAVYENYQKMFE